jgi:hypothetical protein
MLLNVWVQFLFVYLCFTDLIIAGPVLVTVYRRKVFFLIIIRSASEYLTYSAAPQWCEVRQPWHILIKNNPLPVAYGFNVTASGRKSQ